MQKVAIKVSEVFHVFLVKEVGSSWLRYLHLFQL